jgi:hypothetical protein
MTFLTLGFLIRDRMSPDLLARWRSAFHEEVERRGGVVDGQLYDRGVANGVLREVVERAGRRYRDELVPRVRKHMTEDQVEAVEVELSDALARTLAEIKD